MSILPRLGALALAATLGALASGCLERIEKITIRSDRSAELVSTFKGDPADFEHGDALPRAGGPWAVKEARESSKGSGDDKLIRTATLTIPPGGMIPGTYAQAPADEAVSLRFPTSLTVESRADGQYIHFARTYLAREDAPFTIAKRRFQEEPELKRLADAEPASLTENDRRRLIEAFRQIEMEKELRYVRAGVAALNRPQDVGLRIREAAVAAGNSFDPAKALALLAMPQSDERDRAIAELSGEFLLAITHALNIAIAAEKLTADEINAFSDAYEKARRIREVTEDLADERWEVRVKMPGRIVAHNADEVENDELVWTFDSAALMDAERELLATSVVGPAPK